MTDLTQNCKCLVNSLICGTCGHQDQTELISQAYLITCPLCTVMLSDSEAQHLATKLRVKRNCTQKRSLSSSKPLPFIRSKSPTKPVDTDNETRRSALTASLEVLDLLPANSNYAKHRRKIVQRALDVLNAERCDCGFDSSFDFSS